jgi:F0F1-type ATP synthase delta subunit
MTISQALAHTILAYVKDGVGEQASVDKVFSYMDTHGLGGFKPAVSTYLERMIEANRDTAVVTLYAPFPLEKVEKEAILSQFSSDCTVKEIIDSDLIGGYRSEHAYRYVDATTAHALTRLKEHLLHP